MFLMGGREWERVEETGAGKGERGKEEGIKRGQRDGERMKGNEQKERG